MKFKTKTENENENLKFGASESTSSKVLNIIFAGKHTTPQIEKHAQEKFSMSAGSVRTALSRMHRENNAGKTGRGVYAILRLLRET